MNFKKMTENEKAHVMVTLLDFMDQNLSEFNTMYGTIAQNIIKKLRPEGELDYEEDRDPEEWNDQY